MSNSGLFGPTPPGIDLNETQDTAVLSAVISLMIIATIFVVLRVIARTMQKGITLAADDYFIGLGLVFAHGTAICSIVSLPYGGGRHLWGLDAEQFTAIWQILFAYVMIYAFAVSFTKLSIILFYRRIFGMNWGLWFCTFLATSYLLTVIVTIVAACQPIDFFWTQYTNPNATGHCINITKFFFANGIWAMLVDVFILIVPVPIIMKLQMPRSQKLAVMIVLLLGSFVCIASIVRIITIHTVITSPDLTWAMGQLFIWSCCEPYIGIVCACLPTLAPFFRRWWATLVTKNGSDGNKNNSGDSELSDRSADSKNGVSAENYGNAIRSPASPRKTGNKREWLSLQDTVKTRDDDQMELTTDVTASQSVKRTISDEEIGLRAPGDIMIQKDITWESRRVEVV